PITVEVRSFVHSGLPASAGPPPTLAHVRSNSKPAVPESRYRPSGSFIWRCLLASLLLWNVRAGWGLEPTTAMADYGRQSWAMENGLPQNSVHALAQTNDGYIWLGTEAGLVRFDGTSFAVFDQSSNPALPSGDIRCLLATKDGGLWVGTSEGLARWKDGATRTYTRSDGLPGDSVLTLAEAADGVLWVDTDQGLAGLKGERFIPGGPAHSALATSAP